MKGLGLLASEEIDTWITAVLIEYQIAYERVEVRRGATYKILDHGQHIGTIAVVPISDGWGLKESMTVGKNGKYDLDYSELKRAINAIWPEIDRAAKFAEQVEQATPVSHLAPPQTGTQVTTSASPARRRLQDVQANIEREQDLLRQYEKKLTHEEDPRRLSHIRSEIARQKEVIAGYQAEEKNLLADMAGDQITAVSTQSDVPVKAHSTPPGLLKPALEQAQWVALNTTGVTKSLKTAEILQDEHKTAEYVERLVRMEGGINAIEHTAVPHPTPPQPDPEMPIDLVPLSDKIHERFDDSEFRDLCVRLSVKYDDLRGETLQNRIQDLVGKLHRRDRIAELRGLLRQLRPDVDWN